jgi:uncharacterized protein (DUF983 family)
MALLRQRCPRCREGKMFKGPMAMNDPCPVCGLLFQREEGYFLGAMYFSYFLGVAIMLPLFFLLTYLLPEWDGRLLAVLTLVPYIPLMPAVFRYSRTLWIYFERFGDPYDVSAGSYEKMRWKQLAEQKARGADARPDSGARPSATHGDARPS